MPLTQATGGNFDPGSDRDNGDRDWKVASHGYGPWAESERNIGHSPKSVKRVLAVMAS